MPGVALAVLVVALLGALALARCIAMPGRSHRGPLPAATAGQRSLAAALRRDVEHLAGTIGQRNALDHAAGLEQAANWIERSLAASGLVVTRTPFAAAGRTVWNVVGERPGQGPAVPPIVVVGAHYDTHPGTPGANDNGSGVAAGLALARWAADRSFPATLRFAFFANEEQPFFQTEAMGSLVEARAAARRGDPVVAMLSLETMGSYSDEPGSQHYPAPFSLFYPDRGDFIAFVGDTRSRGLVRRCVGAFREGAAFPSEGAALPAFVPGVAWSDHWSYGQAGFPAVMVTDTAPFRDPHYHSASDRPEQLDYDRLARVVEGLAVVVASLAKDEAQKDVRSRGERSR